MYRPGSHLPWSALEHHLSPAQLQLAVLAVSVAAGLAVAQLAGGLSPLLLLPAAAIAGLAVVAALAKRDATGVYLLLAIVLLLEQFQIFGMDDIPGLKIPVYQNLRPVPITPCELVMVAVIVILALRVVTTRITDLRPVPHLPETLALLAMLLFFTALGLARGGLFNIALWEVRALFYWAVMYLISSQVLRTRREVRTCVAIIAACIGLKGLEGCWRYVVDLGCHLGELRAITGHEDALFMLTAFVLLAALHFQGVRGRIYWLLVAGFPPTMVTFILTQRRICWGCLVVCLGLAFLFVGKEGRRKMLRIAVPTLVLGALYTAACWNRTGPMAMPAQKIKSMFVASGKETDDSSNAYRKIEDYNLEQTIRHNPLGLGFGQKYQIYMPLPEVDFPLWDYIPHNCIYWLWCKTGFVGLAVFFFFSAGLVLRIVRDIRRTADPFDRAVLVMILGFIFSQVIIAKYDLQITFYRNMIYIGIATGMWAALRRVREGELAGEGARPA